MAWIAAIVAVPAIIGGWFFAAKQKTNKSAASSGAIANTGDVSSGTAGIVTGHHSPVNLSLQVRDGTSQAALSVHRPWIKIDIEIVGDLVEDDRGIRLEFKSRLHNVGNSPATNVQVWVILACGGKAFPSSEFINRKIPDWLPRIGFSVFPNEPVEHTSFGGLSSNEINDALAEAFATRHVYICAVASVTYRFAGGSGTTRNRYILNGPGILHTIDIGKLPIPKNSLSLQKVPFENVVS